MTSPRLIFNDFFRNPFGGEMKSIGGMGGGDGVLENIQQQVADNGEALQALQGGIGGLPNTPFQPAIENPGQLPDLLDLNPPTSVADAATDSQAQLRAEYEKAVADAKRQRAEGMLGRVVLPGEMSFEEFARMQLKPGPKKSDLFNIAQVEPNPGIGLIQDPGISNITGNLYNDTDTGGLQILDNFTTIDQQIFNDGFRPGTTQLTNAGNRGYTGGGSPPVFSDSVPTPSMDQLFGRAFAGKPI
jgi:hypothetical protein